MFSLEPQRTDYDINFQFFGFPVRIHPLFWLVSFLLSASRLWSGGKPDPEAGLFVLSWVSVVFVSILIHELGHSLMMRYFGQSSHIVLYMLGGLAIADSSFSSFSKPARMTPQRHILISIAGPGAGFLLAAVTVVMIYALGGQFVITSKGFPFFFADLPPTVARPMTIVIGDLLFVNILWGLVNLLPVFPLDGGQISRELFQMSDHSYGFVRALWLSIFVAAGVGLAGWFYLEDRFILLMFLALAASNYMTLQQMTGRGPGGRPW
jgi:Zn-dependent protease